MQARLHRKISGRVFGTVIALELALIALATLLAHGVPGFGADLGPPSVTIQFAPPAPGAPFRAYNI